VNELKSHLSPNLWIVGGKRPFTCTGVKTARASRVDNDDSLFDPLFSGATNPAFDIPKPPRA